MPTVINNSTFLDAFAAGQYTDQQYQTVVAATLSSNLQVIAAADQVVTSLFQYGPTPSTFATAGSDTQITVGLMLARNAPLTQLDNLLAGTWGERQAALAAFPNQAAVWATYGADPGVYSTVQTEIRTALTGVAGNDPFTTATAAGYISTPEDRTIWLTLNPNQFFALFTTLPFKITNSNPNDSGNTIAWIGNLALNDALSPASVAAIDGLWVERNVALTNPLVTASTLVAPPLGPQGIGNAADQAKVVATPAAIAASYNFPLPTNVATDPVALVETYYGNTTVLTNSYNQYRQAVGLAPGTLQYVSGTNLTGNKNVASGELTLDMSVVSGAVPNSTIRMYSDLAGTPYNAYQQVFFDANRPGVLSSSFPIVGQSTAGSPFQWAFQQLMIDGVLANVTVHMAGGDEGASANIPNGNVNVTSGHSSPYTILVGGTSIATLSSAMADPTLSTPVTPAVQSLVQLALNNDRATVFTMVAAGLKTLPSHLSAAAPGPDGAATQLTKMFETVWQELTVTPGVANNAPTTSGVLNNVPVLNASYGEHLTGSGGVTNLVGPPDYQTAFGLGLSGRATPDVTALSAGDARYSTLNDDYVNWLAGVPGSSASPLLTPNGGTSAASPFWASLTTQFNVIFKDQGLPKLGYYTDLLYIADVIAPGSFNDIQLGNNVNGFYTTAYQTSYFNPITSDGNGWGLFEIPTGLGFTAHPGFDLTSGLGSPNGLLLARALTAIAHQQVTYSTSPEMLDSNGGGGWIAGTNESLLFQTFSHDGDATVGMHVGNGTTTLSSGVTAPWAWTARLAQQSLQSDFDPGLVLLFDKQGQGAVGYHNVAAGQSVGVSIDGLTGHALQASMSNPFGFVDFFAGGDAVHVSRAVSIAETVGGANDQLAVVRMRQGGENSLQITLYRVDDYSGTIDGKAPGSADYAALAAGRAYQTTDGRTAISGAGYGQFAEALLKGVDANDIIAMRLDNVTTGSVFWAFAQANEKINGQPAVHMINQGLNTWAWEDTVGLGDHDYNDLIVQLDFTSAHGNGWLVH
jgi:hypothetical protein